MDVTKQIIISSCCVPETDLILLEFLLSVLEKQTGFTWQLSADMSSGDIVLVNLDDKEGIIYYDKLCKEGKVVIAVSADQARLKGDYSLINPMRSADFITVIKRIIDNNSALGNEVDTGSSVTSITDKPPTNDNSTDPALSLDIKRPTFRKLFNILTEDADCFSKPIEVVYREVSIVIDLRHSVFYCEHKLMLLSMLCKANIDSIKVRELSDKEFSVLTKEIVKKPLSELIWCSALLGSSGELIESINQDQAFKLKRWPNLKALVHLPRHITLTAFLSKHRATLGQVVEQTNILATNVVDYINACHLMGYLDQSAKHEEIELDHSDDKVVKQGLFSKLRGKFGIKETG